LARSYKVLKTIVKDDDFVTWRTYSLSKDYYSGHKPESNSDNNRHILFQGIPNSDHILKLKATGRKIPEIKEITIYRPLLNN